MQHIHAIPLCLNARTVSYLVPINFLYCSLPMGNISSKRKNKRKHSQNRSKTQSKINTYDKNNDLWILEYIMNCAKSPECLIMVEGFIDEHCLLFELESAKNPNNKKSDDIQQNIHQSFKKMIEKLLFAKLSEMGVTHQQFEDVCNSQQQRINQNETRDTYLFNQLFLYIQAMKDFIVFKQMMIQRNIDLEAEAMAYIKQQQTQSENNKNSSNIIKNSTNINRNNASFTEEEQMKWAMDDSLRIASQTQSPSKINATNVDSNSDHISSNENILQIEGDLNSNPFENIEQSVENDEQSVGNFDDEQFEEKKESENKGNEGEKQSNHPLFSINSHLLKRKKLKPLKNQKTKKILNRKKKSFGFSVFRKKENVLCSDSDFESSDSHLPMLTATNIKDIRSRMEEQHMNFYEDEQKSTKFKLKQLMVNLRKKKRERKYQFFEEDNISLSSSPPIPV